MPRLSQDRTPKSPQRRLVDDLVWACIGPAIALVGSTLFDADDDYARMFALTWFAIGLVIAIAKYALQHFNRDAPG
jgi:hypothetical protein